MKRFLLVFAIVGLALAGCGGSSAKDADGGSGGGDEFSQLVEKQSKANIRVTYRSGSGDEFTISQDGQGKVAYLKDDEHIITDGNTTTVCNDLDTEPRCQEVPESLGKTMISGYTGIFATATQYLTAAKAADGFGDRSSETIAGRSAECVTLTPASIGGIAGNIAGKLGGDLADKGVKVCADKDTGVFLKWQPVGVDDNNDVVEAIEVTEPEASDFEVPATTATTIPDGTTDDSTDDSTTETSEPDDSEDCTPMTLPGGVTLPSGITLPCQPG